MRLTGVSTGRRGGNGRRADGGEEAYGFGLFSFAVGIGDAVMGSGEAFG